MRKEKEDALFSDRFVLCSCFAIQALNEPLLHSRRLLSWDDLVHRNCSSSLLFGDGRSKSAAPTRTNVQRRIKEMSDKRNTHTKKNQS